MEMDGDWPLPRPNALFKTRGRLARLSLSKESSIALYLLNAGEAETAHEEDLHELGKAGKKLRYPLECFQPVIKGRHDCTIKQLTSVQNKIGLFNDIAASGVLQRTAVACANSTPCSPRYADRK